MAIKDTVNAEVLPKTPNQKKEKHHGPPIDKEKIESVEFTCEEAMSVHESLLHRSENNTKEEQQVEEDLGSSKSLQGH